MSEDYGPWITHDGKGCPCIGQRVQTQDWAGGTWQGIAGEECRRLGRDPNGRRSAWVWSYASREEVVRYRIKRPRALMDLIGMVERMDERADA